MGSNNSTLGTILITTSAFLSGFALGVLLAPRSGKENRQWIAEQADDLTDWVDNYSKQAINETEEKIKDIKKDVQKNLKDSFPDLYKVTEDIGLKEEELINNRDDE